MANELTLSVSFEFSKNDREVSKQTGSLTFDVAGDKFTHTVQEIGITEEAIDLGDVAAGGFCLIHNRDATNFVEIRPATGETDLIQIGPDEPAVFRLTAAAPYAIANTAACEVEILLLEA